jgi:hypothetical protein
LTKTLSVLGKDKSKFLILIFLGLIVKDDPSGPIQKRTMATTTGGQMASRE